MNINLLNFIPELFVAGISFVFGLVVEETFNLINRKKKEERLKKNIQIALDCIFEAEKKVKGKNRGIEKLNYAIDLYQKRAEIKKYEVALQDITNAFNLSRLSS